jgi:hypothetical protein
VCAASSRCEFSVTTFGGLSLLMTCTCEPGAPPRCTF